MNSSKAMVARVVPQQGLDEILNLDNGNLGLGSPTYEKYHWARFETAAAMIFAAATVLAAYTIGAAAAYCWYKGI